jgi:hypothetical protein
MNPSDSPNIALPRRQPSFLAGFLSYLIPGLGQITQGRTAKGLIFMVCLLGMFFAGQAMGDWKNVYLPDLARGPDDPVVPWANNPWRLPKILNPLANLYHRWHFAGQFWIGVAAWPAIWQYNNLPVPAEEKNPFGHNFQRAPRDENEINVYLTNEDKSPDVAWVYTVIAGVLNILVILDAYAGPAYGSTPARPAGATKTEGAIA